MRHNRPCTAPIGVLAWLAVGGLTACNAPAAPPASQAPAPAETPRAPEAQPTKPPAESPSEEPEASFVPSQAPSQPAAEDKPLSAEEQALDARIKQQFGSHCRYERTCGDMVGADCNAAADGPYYYVDKKTLKKISTCGGACMGGRCTNCPPKGWKCAAY